MPHLNDIDGGLFGGDDPSAPPRGDGPVSREHLLAEGWEERFSASGSRLEEMAGHYRALGYDVLVVDAADVAAEGSCTSCLTVEGSAGPVRVIFTRPAAAPPPGDEDLYG